MDLVPIVQDGTVAAGVPGDAGTIADVLAATTAMYARNGFEPPWLAYLAVEGGRVVGTCAFTGPPRAGEAEIAYFTFPGNEGTGVATRMARSLLRIAREAATGPAVVCAHTLPREGASVAILRKLGFEFLGEIGHPEDGRVWKWSKPAPFDS
jgi:RimJ/RimL family protein N-acetyltransferase